MGKSPHISRREFVTITVGLIGAVITVFVGLPAISYMLSPALKSQKTDAWVSLGPLENYPIDQPTLFTFTRTRVNGWEKTVNSFGVYVWRRSDSEVVTYSNWCTHLSCKVTWHEDEALYKCPCHDGFFDEEGKVVHGPPPRPLDRYENKIEDDVLYIRLEEA